MSDTVWIADKSALVRLHNAGDPTIWVDRVARGLVRVAMPTLLELGFSARSAEHWDLNVRRPPASLMPVESLTPRAEARALEVQGLLARQGQHRAPSVPDLLISAIAELSGLTVLHVDKDFELIAALTGQPVQRLQVRA